MTKIVGFDSAFDETSKMVATWRHINVYPKFLSDGHELRQLKGNMANRNYLSKELVKDGIKFLSGSGHGLFDEFQGSDGADALGVNKYHPLEVKGKVVHLLACYTAFELGVDVVKKGCVSFFGYDTAFTFLKETLDDFMSPDAELDFALSQGDTVLQAHERMMNVYEQRINQFVANGNFDAAAIMEFNKDHFCSPVKDLQWGNENAKLSS